ncbi:MAG TPA: class I SAM-dependent methyltransferase [Puia sp.]|nr:class I SAM-dependent methyltransferase [Puia sp.]
MSPEEAFQLINTAPLPSYIIPPVWADLGCGSGLFTDALARMLPDKSIIFGVDKSTGFLSHATPGGVSIVFRQADFQKEEIDLHNLDGILMANALHYVNDKPGFLFGLKHRLNAGASFLIVEYDSDRPVPSWVPYPVSFASLQQLFRDAGYSRIRKLATHPSIYHSGEMYAAFIEPNEPAAGY